VGGDRDSGVGQGCRRLVGIAGAAQQGKVAPARARRCCIEVGGREIAGVKLVDRQHRSISANMTLFGTCRPPE
jgi:hypothetical protein